MKIICTSSIRELKEYEYYPDIQTGFMYEASQHMINGVASGYYDIPLQSIGVDFYLTIHQRHFMVPTTEQIREFRLKEILNK